MRSDERVTATSTNKAMVPTAKDTSAAWMAEPSSLASCPLMTTCRPKHTPIPSPAKYQMGDGDGWSKCGVARPAVTASSAAATTSTAPPRRHGLAGYMSTPKKPKWSIIMVVMTWAVRFKAVEYSAPIIGSSTTVVVIPTTPNRPPVHNHQGSDPSRSASKVTVPTVTHVKIHRHAVPTRNEITDMTHGVETEARRRLLMAD